MIKKILLFSLFANSFLSFSQEIVKEFDLKLEKKRDYFQVTNETDKEVILFLNDKEKVTSIRFDEKFDIKDSLSTTRPEKKYKEIVGYSQNERNYFVFWASEDRKEIAVQHFNFINKETHTTPINLELKKEKIVKEVTINNTFYLITIVKNTSILKFYISDNKGNLNDKTVDLSHLEFKNIFDNPKDLYTVLTDESPEPFLQTIDKDSPPSLALSSKRYKIYTYNPAEVIFTIDNNSKGTQLLRINLHDFTSNLKYIGQPKTVKGQYGAIEFRSNSFLIDNKILQLKTNSFVLFFNVSDFDGNKIKEFKVFHDKEIDFKNSAFFEENSTIENKKTILNTEKFLRKIHNFPSVSCYNLNGTYYTDIGSSVDKYHQKFSDIVGMSSGVTGIGMGNGGLVPISYGTHYMVENLISYRDKFVVYTNCLFDSNFNHIEEKLKTSAFEKARIFLEENKEIRENLLLFKTNLYKDLILFKFDKNLYLGNYNLKDKKYQFFSFTE
jgi:hypothetical protein